MKKRGNQISKIIISAVIISVGLLAFKYLPMYLFGKDILFDASLHIATAIWILYIIWFFIDQNKNWRIPYLIFCFLVLAIISMQRILANAHNDIGLLLGLLIGLLAIGIAEHKTPKKRINF